MERLVRGQRLVASFLDLRFALGLMGMLLPVLLPARAGELQPSISHFYVTPSRDLLVGILFIFAAFLIAYRGYEWLDDLVGDLGGAAALIVALFPSTSTRDWVVKLHVGAAIALFVVFAFYCLFLFPRHKPVFTKHEQEVAPLTPRKRQRDLLYRICGGLILAGLGAIGLYWARAPRVEGTFVFWIEALMLWFFGIAWIVKGNGLLKDK